MTVDEALAWAHRGIVISTEQALREAFDEAHEAGGVLAAEVEWLRGQLSAAHDVRDVFARDLNRMVAESEKDQLDRDAVVASLTDELRRAKAKAEQYQIDWMEAKAEFGDKMAVLRQQCEMEERARQKAEQMAITALAEKQQAEAAMEATLRACPNCEGTGVMSVLVAVHPPDEREEYADEPCAECGGHGLSSYGQMERDLVLAQKSLAAERIAAAHLREAFVTMERAASQHKRDLAAARAVLATAKEIDHPVFSTKVEIDRAAWLAWQERQR